MVCKHRFLKIRDKEVLEVNCSSCGGRASFDSKACSKAVADLKTENTSLVCLKTPSYNKLFFESGKKGFLPFFVRYYFGEPGGEIIEEKVFASHKVIISKKGVELFYNIYPKELELSFKEINILNNVFDKVSEIDIPEESLSIKKHFNSFNLNNKLLDIIFRYTFGFGALELFFLDNMVQDVFIDSPNTSNAYLIHEKYGECISNVFVCSEELEKFASKLRLLSNRPFDSSHPVLNTSVERLSLRVTGVMEPLTFSGVAFAFRKHRSKPFTLPALVRAGFISVEGAALLSFLVDSQVSILITGSRGSGKTSLLSALMFEVPRNNRFLVIEDTSELPVAVLRENGFRVQSLRVKSSFFGGYEVSAVDALRAALRLGESVLVIGEVRGEEARALFEAMRVGAAGNVVMGTIHGSSAFDTFDRIVNDLGVERTSFKATDIVVSAGFLRRKDSLLKSRSVFSITEVRKEWSSDPAREGGFFEIADLVNNKISLRGSKIIRKIAIGKGMSMEEVKDNLMLRGRIIKLLAEKEISLADYVKIKDRYYELVDFSIQKTEKLDYNYIFNKLEELIDKC